MSLLLLFNQQPVTQTAGLAFYLLAGGLPESIGAPMVALPAQVTFGGGDFMLAAAYLDDDQNTQMLAANPQPDAWTGTVAAARQLLRENDLIHAWWIFDWFAASTGATSDAGSRSI